MLYESLNLVITVIESLIRVHPNEVLYRSVLVVFVSNVIVCNVKICM